MGRRKIKPFGFPSRILALFLAVSLSSWVPTGEVFPYWVWSRESGKFINPNRAVEDTADKQLDYALDFYKKKDFKKAEEELRKLVKYYPGAKAAPEAQYKLGLLYEEQGDYYKAFRAYKRLLEYYPQSEKMDEVLGRLFRIGNLFLSGKRAKVMGFPILPAIPRAIEVFELIIKTAPFHELGPKAMFRLGVAYRRARNYSMALETFQSLLDTYPSSPLVPDAKFQLAEVSFEMSSTTVRDEQALKEAEDYFEEFLGEYPDSNVQKKATRLKEEIDNLNAKKYFEIGEYYENDKQLRSATIYYEDVQKNYPKTVWAIKAREKLAMFKAPGIYIRSQEERFASRLGKVEHELSLHREKIAGLPRDAAEERNSLEQKIKALEKKERGLAWELKSFHRRKIKDIRKKFESIKQREQELKKKYKNLQAKKKLLKKNPSEDLRKALDSWFESLRSEEWALVQEKGDLIKLRRDLGMGAGKKLERFLPFLAEKPVGEIAQMHQEDLSRLEERKRSWELRKDELYQVLERIRIHLGEMTEADIQLFSRKGRFERGMREQRRELKKRRARLAKERSAIEQIRSLYESKQEAFQRQFGKSAGFLAKQKALLAGTWHLLTFGSESPEEEWKKVVQERGRLLAEIEERRGRIETIRTAFEDELKGKKAEEKRKGKQKEREPKPIPAVNVKELKKKIRGLEKEIRWRYHEVEDRNELKKEKVTELNRILGNIEKKRPITKKLVGWITSPFRGFGRFWKVFFFGLRSPAGKATEEAGRFEKSKKREPEYAQVKQMKSELEFESLMIEARIREIEGLKKQVERLKKQGEISKGFSYRAQFVERSGGFLNAILRATRDIIPIRRRKKLLIDRLDEETRKFQELAGELELVNLKIQRLESEMKAAQAKPIGDDEELRVQKEAEYELESLRAEIERREAAYREETERVEFDFKKIDRDAYSVELKEHLEMKESEIHDQKKYFEEERIRTQKEILAILSEQRKILREEGELIQKTVSKMEREIRGRKETADTEYTVLQKRKQELVERLKEIGVQKEGLRQESARLLETLQARSVRIED